MTKPFGNLRSAAVDGRLLNPITRKVQLKQLHDALSDKAADIQDAITKDTGHSAAEVLIEYSLAMKQLAQAYTALNTTQALEAEYAVSRNQNAPQARQAVGIVLIDPSKHAFFSSLMSALVPALASGNCIIVQSSQSLLQTPRLILPLIASALDHDIFATTNDFTDEDVDHPHIRVLQNGSASPNLAHHLVSDPSTRVVAIVERDADLDAAARELVAARFALRGRAAYASDVVLVNEWVKKAFLQAVVKHAVGFASAGGEGNEGARRAGQGRGMAESVRGERGVNVLSWGAGGAVVDVEDRQSSLLRRKVQESCLLVHSVTSIDDAIDFSKINGRLGAAYVFTKPSAAKYICQFLDTPASFINHVPTSLLFMPMAPLNGSINPTTYAPYGEADFTRPKAQFTTLSPAEASLARVLQNASPDQLARLATESTAKLPPVARGTQGITHIGFFNQGIVTGGILLLSTVFATAGTCVYYGWGMLKGHVLFFRGVGGM
ncbi:hypothetical protein C8A05DRAFT_13923 [Staphylotrichum tortipilum]|uniref:Aldehyde dehydrogenase domain-containing protein n=1 Tax=Staphylotrichum tortipilum TaxID=2831512 RepID=A0AAN6MNH1_9PEZI|nr:hypothetical protein C8A05DRAFT_13923 [Staphylotrichum longicolle]